MKVTLARWWRQPATNSNRGEQTDQTTRGHFSLVIASGSVIAGSRVAGVQFDRRVDPRLGELARAVGVEQLRLAVLDADPGLRALGIDEAVPQHRGQRAAGERLQRRISGARIVAAAREAIAGDVDVLGYGS